MASGIQEPAGSRTAVRRFAGRQFQRRVGSDAPSRRCFFRESVGAENAGYKAMVLNSVNYKTTVIEASNERGMPMRPRKVYILHHIYDKGLETENVKLIGVYSSRGEAQRAINRLQTQPGFRELVEGFEVEAYTLDEDNWKEGFV
jgi:hypothetical protein